MTSTSPEPAYAFVPTSRSTAPQMSDGSRPPARSAVQTSAVVVLLPWVPATATTRLPVASSLQASSRFQTARPVARAAATSTFVSPYALERMTTSAPATFRASNERKTRAPASASDSASGHVPRSEPETVSPRASSSRATADMPMPPTPTMWKRVTPNSRRAHEAPPRSTERRRGGPPSGQPRTCAPGADGRRGVR